MQHINAEELQKKLIDKDLIFLLDVREDWEHRQFDIGGTLIPLGEVTGKAAEIPTDRPVVVYCKKGIRSQIAIQRLEEKFGFTNLINLRGGLDNWQQ